MTDSNKDIQINSGADGPVIKTVAEYNSGDGYTAHYQGIQLFFKNAGTTSEVATNANPFPVTIPSTGVNSAGAYIGNFNEALTASAGGTGFLVIVDSTTGVTVDMSGLTLASQVGLTAESVIRVVGASGAGAGALTALHTGWNEPFFCVTGPTGTSGRFRAIIDEFSAGATVGVTGNHIGILGHSGAGNVGVTGYVTVQGITSMSAMSSLSWNEYVVPVNTPPKGITIAGGVTGMQPLLITTGVVGSVGATLEVTKIKEPVAIQMPTGITFGRVSYTHNDLPTPANGFTHGVHLGKNHGLSSGVKITVLNTGTTADYVYVGGPTAGTNGITVDGYPMRQFDTLFIETNNVNTVFVAADNAAADIRFIGS
jgi:hypothetical protein